MVKFDPLDLAILEIGSGSWFFLSICLIILFSRYAVEGMRKEKVHIVDPTIQASIALAIFSSGTALRAFLFWHEFISIHRGIETHIWQDKWPWFALSIALNAAGAAWSIWIFTPSKWRLLISAGTVLIALLIPIWLFLSI